MGKKEKSSKKKPKQFNNFARFSGIGLQMGAIIALGAWIGSSLDDYYQTSSKPLTIILILFAIAVSLYLVIKEVVSMSKDDDK